MKLIRVKFSAFFLIMLFTLTARSSVDSFVIQGIELVNARRISLATVLSHMPVGVGDRLTRTTAKDIISSLYATGFFKDISLSRRGNTLLVQVKERPAIAKIEFDGNSKVKDEVIENILDDVGLVDGAIFNDQVLDKMQKEMERAYYSYGRYGVKLNTHITPLPRNRVNVKIDIQEGRPSKIREIKIIGNNSFSDDEILDEFELGIPSWWAWFSSKNQYSKERFYDDIKVLESFYTSRGYINYKVNSVQVTISPDKKDIYISINITEGDQYRVGKVSVTGETILENSVLTKIAERVNVSGEYYSSEKTTDTIEYFDNRLGGIGYAFAETELNTSINEDNKTVDLNFVVNPGKRVYVRNIRFSGNEKAKDEVYRREMRQLEGAWYSKALVERSKTRLERIPFVEEAEVETLNVAGTDDQVDVAFQIKERLAGSFNAGVGYSDLYKLTLNVGLQHSNMFGSGNALSVSVNSSKVIDSLAISYTDPYATEDGVARTYSFSYTEYDTTETSVVPYLNNTKRVGLSYQIPISEFSSMQVGASLSVTDIIQTVDSYIAEINDFIDEHGKHHEQLMIPVGYVFDTRNRTIFPDRGTRQSVGLSYSTAGSDLSYYILSHRGDTYWPSVWSSVFRLRTDIVYGAGRYDLKELPFYEKLSTGGNSSIRGFEPRSLGPRGTLERPDNAPIPTDSTLGGDLLTTGSLEWIFKPGKDAEGSARIVLFYDFGNAFATKEDFDINEFRTSYGVALRWLSPMGAMTLSYAEPIKRQRAVPANDIPGDPAEFGIRADKVERFQFNVGASF